MGIPKQGVLRKSRFKSGCSSREWYKCSTLTNKINCTHSKYYSYFSSGIKTKFLINQKTKTGDDNFKKSQTRIGARIQWEYTEKNIYYWRSSSWCSNYCTAKWCKQLEQSLRDTVWCQIMVDLILSGLTKHITMYPLFSVHSIQVQLRLTEQLDMTLWIHPTATTRHWIEKGNFKKPLLSTHFGNLSRQKKSASQSTWRGRHLTSKTETSTGNMPTLKAFIESLCRLTKLIWSTDAKDFKHC